MRSGVSLLLLLAPGFAAAAVPVLIAAAVADLAIALAEICVLILLTRAHVWAVQKIQEYLKR